MDEPVWVATVFSKNRERLLEGEIAAKFFAQVLDQARVNDLLSDEHCSVEESRRKAQQRHASVDDRSEARKGSGHESKPAKWPSGSQGGGALDRRTARHAGYPVSQRKRKRSRKDSGG